MNIVRHTLAVASALALCLGAYGSAQAATAGSGAQGALDFKVQQNVQIAGSPTFDRARKAGKIVIGIKEDQPGFGTRDAATGQRSGFDIDLSRWVAAELGFPEKDIKYVLVPTPSREQSLINGDTDIIIGMYTISDKRKKLVDFAGPYMADGYGILVRADNTDIKKEADMAGHKICSITGSTPVQYIREHDPKVTLVEFDNTAQCIQALLGGQVDGVSTDQPLLVGYATQLGGKVKVVDDQFAISGFGIALAKGNASLRHYINHALEGGHATLEKIWDHNLGSSGVKYQPVPVDDYK